MEDLLSGAVSTTSTVTPTKASPFWTSQDVTGGCIAKSEQRIRNVDAYWVLTEVGWHLCTTCTPMHNLRTHLDLTLVRERIRNQSSLNLFRCS